MKSHMKFIKFRFLETKDYISWSLHVGMETLVANCLAIHMTPLSCKEI
jgi:hypothetical protein